jgi:hypothetical protein
LLLVSALLITSACGEVTWWDAQGAWSGGVILPGEVETQRSGNVSDPTAGPDENRIRLCELSTMDLGLTFVPIQRDRPAAIQVRTERPLCRQGRTRITGGAVLVWANPASDPNVLAAVRSDAWTIAGEIDVTTYLDRGVPDLDAGETANSERVEGTLSLTATNGAGSVIRIDRGTFQLTVLASRVKFSPS